MSSRFPVWPPQRLPRPAFTTVTGPVNVLSGGGGETLYYSAAQATWMGHGKALDAPSTVPWVAARVVGGFGSSGSGINTSEFGIYLVGANKSINWFLEDSTQWQLDRNATSAWPPGAYETTYVGLGIDVQTLGPYVGLWFDRTVSPARVRPFMAMDLAPGATATAAPGNAIVFTTGAFGPTLSGGGADDIGAPVSWGISYLNTAAVYSRVTVTEASEGTFAGGNEPNPDISGNTGQGTQLVGRGPYTVGRGHFLGGTPSSWWNRPRLPRAR